MSHAEYLSNIFHDFGDVSIQLNYAMNTIVRSYRSEVQKGELEDANNKVLSLLCLSSTDDSNIANRRILQMKFLLSNYIEKNQLQEQIETITRKLKNKKELSNGEVSIVDSLIGLINREAEMAYRRMRSIL